MKPLNRKRPIKNMKPEIKEAIKRRNIKDYANTFRTYLKGQIDKYNTETEIKQGDTSEQT